MDETPRMIRRPGAPGLPARLLAVLLLAAVTGGCALFEAPPAPTVARAPVEHPPLVTDRFVLSPDTDVVGEIQVIRARYEDTFVDIARAYDLGYDELVDANPGVDPWLPGEGTRIVLPTQFVLPDGPRTGIVLNLAAKRLFYFPKPAAGEPAVVITHPVGIGREGWQTPLGTTKVVAKTKDPVWVVPPSIRKEHAAQGNPLPARVPPGPDNPLGRHALRLGFPSYLIHGTNKPSGIGMRVSHGCIQLFPEDIESLFGQVAVGTPVRIVNQPVLLGWRDGNLYLEVHPPLEDDKRNHDAAFEKELNRRITARLGTPQPVDAQLLASTRKEARGFPVPILMPAADAASVVARARPTRNVVTYAEESPTAEAPATP
jgi:L,D-transpeptidase ErfK/SrfK